MPAEATATIKLKRGFGDPKQELPIMYSPEEGTVTKKELINWINDNKKDLEQEIIKHGAILFRGFPINDPQDFEDVAKAIDPDLKNNYLGTSPRNAVTEYVFSASELPGYYPIMQHCEMSFLPNPPRKLFFFCNIEPADKTGETPLVDFRKVYQQMDPIIRKEFEEKGIRNIRNYNGPANKGKFDLWKLKRWDEMFLTTDKEKIAQTCKEYGLDVTWKDDDRLVLVNDQEAISKHPVTGEPVWFNHLQVFHQAAAAIEYGHIAKRQKNIRAQVFNLFTTVMSFAKTLATAKENQAMNCVFRDGSRIPESYVEHVEKVIWDNMSFTSWRKGDVLAIDNYSTAHGRMPYEGPREILVCWSSNK